jgi:hypothetical protein
MHIRIKTRMAELDPYGSYGCSRAISGQLLV